eukprot:4674130-Prymnesium_polylepis.1
MSLHAWWSDPAGVGWSAWTCVYSRTARMRPPPRAARVVNNWDPTIAMLPRARPTLRCEFQGQHWRPAVAMRPYEPDATLTRFVEKHLRRIRGEARGQVCWSSALRFLSIYSCKGGFAARAQSQSAEAAITTGGGCA